MSGESTATATNCLIRRTDMSKLGRRMGLGCLGTHKHCRHNRGDIYIEIYNVEEWLVCFSGAIIINVMFTFYTHLRFKEK